jgi:YD repeat-containing protein
MRKYGRFAASFLSLLLACGPAPRALDRAGRPVTLAVAGRPATIVHFWATWCGPCRAELPALIAFAAERHIPLITIANDRDWSVVDRYLAANDLHIDVLLDRDARVARSYRADVFPTTLVYDAHGQVTERFRGAVDWRGVTLRMR